MKTLIQRLVKAMTDEELVLVRSEVFNEEESRGETKRASFPEPPELSSDEKRLACRGSYCSAILAYRTRTGFGLMDSRDAVDAFNKSAEETPPPEKSITWSDA